MATTTTIERIESTIETPRLSDMYRLLADEVERLQGLGLRVHYAPTVFERFNPGPMFRTTIKAERVRPQGPDSTGREG